MNALSEMNMTNLAKMSGKLPIALQVMWRDEALRIRESRGFPNLKDLADFIERRAEAANDSVFRRVNEMSNCKFGKNTLEVAVKYCLLSRVEQLI